MKKILLLNDTSNELHVGSSSISFFIKSRFNNHLLESVSFSNGNYSLNKKFIYDKVVINAEGTLSRPTERAFKLASVIKELDLDCCLILLNADICCELAAELSGVNFDYVHYRRYHEDNEKLNCADSSLLPDMFYMICTEFRTKASINSTTEYVLFGDSHDLGDFSDILEVKNNFPKKIKLIEQSMIVESSCFFGNLVGFIDRFKNRIWFLSKSPIARWRKKNSQVSFEEWLNRLHGAQLLVTGRFHHIVAALALGVPVVYVESSTNKMRCLSELFCESNITPYDLYDVEKHIEYIERYESPEFDYSELLKWL